MQIVNLGNMEYNNKTISREDLIGNYADRIIDGMDMKTMVQVLSDMYIDRLSSYDDAELIAEVKEYAEDLIDTAAAVR